MINGVVFSTATVHVWQVLGRALPPETRSQCYRYVVIMPLFPSAPSITPGEHIGKRFRDKAGLFVGTPVIMRPVSGLATAHPDRPSKRSFRPLVMREPSSS
jgi:hypothetical protein